ncbi:hypothetical protein K4G97_24885, partial [Mycobacterium tuberculosis]|nr:hypothetical protein [Mycobacterium tuberculosis]
APDTADTIDFGVASGRDFAPERARKDNVYDAVSAYLKECLKADKKPIIASYSAGARERLKGLLSDHGAPRLVEADSWQTALG